ncbi:APC family permease [Agromyces silvae]|uniref:APC family permease n=1 Tax=Agromyces silvae TaxID=3388266 RepID=UPI00280A7F88|nr:APC family permease [Agromyces protaetiae]
MEPEQRTDIPREERLVADLQGRRISLAKAINFGFVSMQIGPSMAIFAGYLLLTGGGGSWFSIVLAVPLILSVTEVVRVFSQRFVATGGLMTYLVQANRRRSGLFVGSANLIGYLALSAAVATSVTYFAQAVFYDLGLDVLSSPGAQAATFVIVGALMTVTALTGLRIASTVAIVLGAACIPFIVWITVQALAVAPDVHWGALSPEFGNIALLVAPVTLVLANFIGFDGLAFLAAETPEPQRNVPRILHTVAIGSLGIYLVIVVAQIPVLSAHTDAIAEGFSPLSILAAAAGLEGLGTLLNVMLCLALFAAGIATLTYGSRLFAAAATIGLLPRAVATLTPVSRTPIVAIVILGIAAAVLPAIVALSFGMSPIEAGIYFAEGTAYMWAAPYVVAAIAAAVLVWRSRRRVLISLAATIVCAVGYAAFLVYVLSLGWATPETALPWISSALILVVFLVVLIVDQRRGRAADLRVLDESV